MARETSCDFCGKSIDVMVKTLNGYDFVLANSVDRREVFAAFDACPDCLQKVVEAIDSMFLRNKS